MKNSIKTGIVIIGRILEEFGMKKKSEKIKKVIDQECANKVMLCTPKFCACGCYDEAFSDDYVVGLKDVEVTFHDDKNNKIYKETMCICDEYIIAFEPIKND